MPPSRMSSSHWTTWPARVRTLSNRQAMRRSTNRILVSHAGTLPRPNDLQELFAAGDSRREAFLKRLPSAVHEAVRRQAEIGIDVVDDGEFSKLNFSHYARDRLSGLEQPSDGARQV